MTHDSREVSDYRPIGALGYWDVIGEFVTDAVTDTALQSGRAERTLYPAAVAFVLWCWQSRGTPLERRRIFRLVAVEEFIHLGMTNYTVGSRATHRSTLVSLVKALNPTEMPRPHLALPRSEATKPYSTSEIAALASWASSQGTRRRQTDSTALLTLGLGAGLATREILGVRAADLDMRDDQVYVIVWEGRARAVPILADWQRCAKRILAQREPNEWLFRPGRGSAASGQITDFLLRSRTELEVRPSRMRTTWLLRHLATGTAPRELLHISGLKNLAALDKIANLDPKTGHTMRRSNSHTTP